MDCGSRMAKVAIKSGVSLCSSGEVLELVEQAGLENRCTLTGTVGSNPTLSAIIVQSRR